MKNKIFIEEDSLIIKIPLTAERFEPYNEKPTGEMKNIAGMITKDKHGNEEMGFCHYIDFAYKGKDDQNTDFFYKYWDGEQEDFEELCKKLKLDIIYY